ncbi:peroxiredoxin, Ohr subfamily [Streptomyces sp. AmelKG-A3]|nr:peroxiredoxin, Ohr subfamily [Streptomyces sp. PalvLS-984]SDC96286.1 peroxiredoxin, Ohr subfamily [Streptomyces sp. AmelKG-A3]
MCVIILVGGRLAVAVVREKVTDMDALYTAAATANGREGRAVSSDGRIDLALALPPALGGDGEGTNPEQLFAAGYAACFASAMGAVGREMKIDTKDAAVTAEVSIGKDGDGFGLAVVLRVELPRELEGETGRRLVETAHAFCPYSKATRGNIDVQLVIE